MTFWNTIKLIFGFEPKEETPVTLADEMKNFGKPVKVKKEKPTKFVKEVPAKKVYIKKNINDKEVFIEEKTAKKLEAVQEALSRDDLAKKEANKPKKPKRIVEGNAKNLYTTEEWKNKKGK